MLHRKMYLQYIIFYQCNGIKYILKKIQKQNSGLFKKKRKKKEIPENILTEVLPLGELKYMQHKHHSYKYVLYVGVSCASSR